MRKIRVLVIDDSPFSQAVIQKTLPEANFEICGLAANGQQGIGKYSVLKPDAVIMDITMPDMDGLECSRQILLRDPAARIVLLSSMKDDALTARARLLGIRWFLQKPATRDDLVGMIKLAISRVAPEWWAPYQEQLRLSFEEFVSKSLEPQTCKFTRIENPSDSWIPRGFVRSSASPVPIPGESFWTRPMKQPRHSPRFCSATPPAPTKRWAAWAKWPMSSAAEGFPKPIVSPRGWICASPPPAYWREKN
jgi:DNA-binding NarL/FixJ family response regulator